MQLWSQYDQNMIHILQLKGSGIQAFKTKINDIVNEILLMSWEE